MEAATPMFIWPAEARPGLHTAGVFRLDDRGFAYCYQSHTHAVHLHEYDGAIKTPRGVHPLKAGTLTISPAGEPSWYDLPSVGQHWCVHFHPAEGSGVGRGDSAEGGSTGPMTLPLVRALGEAQGEASQRLSRVVLLQAQAGADRSAGESLQVAASVAFHDFLCWLWLLGRGHSEHRPSQPDPIQRVMGLLSYKLHRVFSVKELAAHVGWSPGYLAKRFRQRTGLTIAQYLLQKRLERARLLLLTTDLPIKQVGARVGLADAQYFNKQARRVFGCSPTELRQGR
jgi:AraC-like DNA-binding protein